MMLEKVIHIVVALLLILTTAGFTVSKHYCNDNLVSVSIYGDAARCNHQNHDSCCHNSINHFQVEDEFKIKQSSNLSDLTARKSLLFSATNLFATQENSLQNFQFAVLKIPLSDQPGMAKLQRFLL